MPSVSRPQQDLSAGIRGGIFEKPSFFAGLSEYHHTLLELRGHQTDLTGLRLHADTL